jgi:hypothetical protein
MVKPVGVVALAVLAGAVLAARGSAPAQTPPDTSPKALAAAGTRYVEDYANKMLRILGDEVYTQETFDSIDHRTASRLMKGELFLTFLPADHTWVAVHDIAEVDGEPVPNRQSLQMLLSRGTDSSVIADVARHNAHYNIGRIQRTFNEPTLALLVLDKSHVANFTFSRKLVETRGGVTLVTLAFTEKDRPTIVASNSGGPVFARGELLIEAGTGRVRATHIMFKDGDVTADLKTIYMLDARLELWLPMTFAERYEGEFEGLKEIDTGLAQYSNFKRYETSGRIKKQRKIETD